MKECCEVAYLERAKNVSSTMRREEGSPIVKIGIVGIGRVSGRFPQELKYVRGTIDLGAFNSNGAHAGEFAERHELSFGESDYEKFLIK